MSIFETTDRSGKTVGLVVFDSTEYIGTDLIFPSHRPSINHSGFRAAVTDATGIFKRLEYFSIPSRRCRAVDILLAKEYDCRRERGRNFSSTLDFGETAMIFEEQGNTLYCRFDGELNSDVCGVLESQIADQVAVSMKKHPVLKLVFDLEGTRYICSAFLRICLYHCKLVGIKNFRIVNSSEDIKRVFTIAGFVEMMSIS